MERQTADDGPVLLGLPTINAPSDVAADETRPQGRDYPH
jgi:hypothetical protein